MCVCQRERERESGGGGLEVDCVFLCVRVRVYMHAFAECIYCRILFYRILNDKLCNENYTIKIILLDFVTVVRKVRL